MKMPTRKGAVQSERGGVVQFRDDGSRRLLMTEPTADDVVGVECAHKVEDGTAVAAAGASASLLADVGCNERGHG